MSYDAEIAAIEAKYRAETLAIGLEYADRLATDVRLADWTSFYGEVRRLVADQPGAATAAIAALALVADPDESLAARLARVRRAFAGRQVLEGTGV